MPVDVEPSDKGNLLITDEGECRALATVELAELRSADVPLRTSHFATCPGAIEHRKPKEKSQ